jgi:hypothetical protein
MSRKFLSNYNGRVLHIEENDIRRHGPGNLLGVCWRQWRAERALARRGVHFRTTDVATRAAVYACPLCRHDGRASARRWFSSSPRPR